MDTATFRRLLGDILREEERADVDWDEVELMCRDLYLSIEAGPEQDYPHIVEHFLSDADIRARDADYGRNQRIEIAHFVETGECNDSKPASSRILIFFAVAVGALLLWFFI